MAPITIGTAVEKLGLGLLLRCPNCGKGHMFHGLFQMGKVCPVCGVRWERLSGESTGAMYINLIVAEVLSLGGFFVFQALFNPPWVPHIAFWVVFNLAFIVLFYRHSRGLWVAISYLTGGVYVDPSAPGSSAKSGGTRP